MAGVYGFDSPAGCAEKNQSADGARIPQARRPRRSHRLLLGETGLMIARILRTSEFEFSALAQRMFAAVSPARSRSLRRAVAGLAAGLALGALSAHAAPT